MKKRLVLALVMMCLILSGCGKSNAVRNAEEKIAAIGTVTADSGAAIADAEAAMDALSAKEREKVENAAELPAARDAWKKAIAEREERERQTRLETLRRELLGSWEFTQEVTDEYAELIDRMIGSMMGFTEIHFSDYVDRIAATGSFTLLGNGTYKIGFTAAQRETFLDSIVTPIKRYYADIMRDLIAQELAFSGIVIDDIHSDEAWVSATGMDFNSLVEADLGMSLDAYIDYIRSLDIDDPSCSEKLRDAVRYTLNQEDKLRRFLDDPMIPADNGFCERSIRPLATARRNWLFSYSVSGAESAAILFTLVETAKANQAHPYYYLKYLLETLPKKKTTKGNSFLDDCMPWSESYMAYERIQKRGALSFLADTNPPEVPRTPRKMDRCG